MDAVKSDLSVDQHALIDLTNYPRRLRQLNGLFASGEPSWASLGRDDLVYYLTTLLLWHELEHSYDIDSGDWVDR